MDIYNKKDIRCHCLLCTVADTVHYGTPRRVMDLRFALSARSRRIQKKFEEPERSHHLEPHQSCIGPLHRDKTMKRNIINLLLLLYLEAPGLHAWVAHSFRAIDQSQSTRRRSELFHSDGGCDSDLSSSHRRLFLLTAPLTLFSGALSADARGLVKFPCEQLSNKYHLMRAGTSLLEEENIWSTNPLFLTNREDALSLAGQEEVVSACKKIANMDHLPTVVKYSLAASCIDTSNIVGQELRLGRDRLIPEFTFLDPRAIGRWDMLDLTKTRAAVWALDADEAGPSGLGARPPPNIDGTPHETLSDQAIRLRQLLSVLESQYSGDTILLIFPDGTGPALLSAMIAGIPYNRIHELEFSAGEIRLDVTKNSVLDLWKRKQGDLSEYAGLLEEGRKQLAILRQQTGDIVSLKDVKLEEERIAIDKAYQEKETKRKVKEEKEKEKWLERQRETISLNEAPISPNAFAAVAGIALVGGASFLAMGSRGSNQVSSDLDSIAPKNSKMLVVETGPNVLLNMSTPMDLGLTESMQKRALFAPIERINGEKEKSEAAATAMEEYMDRDDGADDWLRSISEIVEEDQDTDPDDLAT